MSKDKMFKVMYNPNPFPVVGEYCLIEKEDRNEAIQAAIEYSKTYYGESSNIWVMHGRKKVFDSAA